jgi:hypothetical protein
MLFFLTKFAERSAFVILLILIIAGCKAHFETGVCASNSVFRPLPAVMPNQNSITTL